MTTTEKQKLKIAEGRVYVNKDYDAQQYGRGVAKHRRVVGIVNGRVFYSSGGDFLRDCKLRTFERWARTDITTAR